MLTEKIEEEITLHIPHGEISLYESNKAFSDYEFCFEQPSIAMMLNGTKNIKWKDEEFEFSRGKIFIPQKNKILKVGSACPSPKNPMKCAIIKMDESFIADFYDEIISLKNTDWLEILGSEKNELLEYFVSDEDLLINSFYNLLNDRNTLDQKIDKLDMIFNLKLKQLTYLILRSRARNLVLEGLKVSTNNPLFEVVNYIEQNFKRKIFIKDLAKVAMMSETKLYNTFKTNFGCTPTHFIIQKRLQFATKLIKKTSDAWTISEICFESGFNSVAYFNRKFKEVFEVTPLQYRNQNI